MRAARVIPVVVRKSRLACSQWWARRIEEMSAILLYDVVKFVVFGVGVTIALSARDLVTTVGLGAVALVSHVGNLTQHILP